MKKILLVLFMVLGLLFLVSCEKKDDNKDKDGAISNTVTETEWNNIVKDYAFAKKEDTKLTIKIYEKIIDDLELEYVMHKDGLTYKFINILHDIEFATYCDFKNKLGYLYYGIDHNNYFKKNYDVSVEENVAAILENFNAEFSKVKFENGEYIVAIPYEGSNKYAHYSFLDGNLKEFKIYFDNKLEFKATFEPLTTDLVLPNVNYIDEMSPNEMKTYVTEALKELKSYGAVNQDYKVDAYAHYTLASFEYLRLKNDDNTYKTLEQLLNEIKTNLVNNFFGKRVKLIEQTESLDEYMWFGQFEDGNNDGLIIKLNPRDGKLMVTFGVVDKDILDIILFKEYLENRLVDDPEEYDFYFDGKNMIDTKDCLLISYKTEKSGNYEDVLAYALTCVTDNGYTWTSSESSSDYHLEIYEKDNKAIMLYFTSDGENDNNIKVVLCVSFGDKEAASLIDFGVESPLFE